MSPKLLRYGLFWLSTLFLLVIPIIIVGMTFDMFHREGWGLYQFTFTGMIILILSMLYFKKHFEKWVESLPFSMGRGTLGFLMTIAPYFVLYLVVRYARVQAELMQTLMFRIIVFAVIGAIIREAHLYFKEVETETKRFEKWGS